MKVLSISLDKGLFNKASDVYWRHQDYVSWVKKYIVIVFTLLSDDKQIIFEKNLKIIPTQSKNKLLYLWDAVKIVWKNREEKFNLVTVQDPFLTGMAGIITKFLLKIPLNIQIHSEFFNSKYYRQESLFNFIMYWLGRFVLYFADSVRARNLKIKKDLERNYSGLCGKINYVGASLNKVYLGSLENTKRDKNLIVASARLVEQKNLPMMFEVIKKLKTNHPKIKLALFDGGPLKSKIESIILEKNIKENVELMGWQPPVIYKKYLEKAAMTIITSNHEGWSLVALESLSRGTPVVMTDTGCADEIVVNNKTGFVVPVGDIDNFVEKTEYVLSHQKEAFEMARKGREFVKKDSDKSRIKKQMLAMFNLTLKS